MAGLGKTASTLGSDTVATVRTALVTFDVPGLAFGTALPGLMVGTASPWLRQAAVQHSVSVCYCSAEKRKRIKVRLDLQTSKQLAS